MSAIPSNDTFLNTQTLLTVIGGGAGASSTITTSTLIALDVISFNISTTFLEVDNAVISSISTLGIYLDGALLTTAGGSELLLNGVPVATTSNISSLSDWSLDPAISTVNMNANNIIAAADISSLSAHVGYISTQDISVSTIYADQSFAFDASVSTLFATDSISTLEGSFSTVVAGKIGQILEINGLALVGGGNLIISGVSTVNGEPYNSGTSSINTSSINSQTANISSLISQNASISSLTAQTGSISSLVCQDISTVTLTAFSTIHAVSTISSLTLEAGSLAVSSIKSQGSATSDLTLDGTARFLNMYSQGMSNVVDRGLDFGGNAFYRVVAQNGNAGEISFTAEPGILGNFGRIGMTANGGTLAGVGLGGLVEITANTPFGSLCNASSAIKLSAAGINSYAGAIPAVGSLTGYNFIYGTLGVNITAGLPPSLPNTPGTVYFYGTNGVVTGSPFYAYEILGYWNGLAAPSNLRITGRQTISGNSQVVVSNVDSIFFDPGYGALTGVSSINNTPYPPAFSVPANLNISSLNATSSITADSATFSTLNNISSVNGSSYPPTFAVPENLVVSTLTAADYVSTLVLEGVSSIESGDYLSVSINNTVSSFIQMTNPYSTDSLLLGPAGAVLSNSANSTFVGIIGAYPEMRGPGGSKVEFDTFGNIQISTVGATVLSPDTGVVNLGNTGTLNFDPLGRRAINNVSTVTGTDINIQGVSVSITDGGFTGVGLKLVSGSLELAGVSSINGSDNGLVVQTKNQSTIISLGNDGSFNLASVVGQNISFTSDSVLNVSSLGAVNINAAGSGSDVNISNVGEISFDLAGVRAITNISTINGEPYGSPNLVVSTLTAETVSTASLEVSSINGSALPFDLPWTSTLGTGGFTSSLTGTNITTPVLVASISFPQPGNYTIYQKISAVKTAGGANQDVHMNILYGDANVGVSDVYEGIGSVPYMNEQNVSTLTTLVANAQVSSINDTKNIYVFDQSNNNYTVDLVAANPVISYNPAP